MHSATHESLEKPGVASAPPALDLTRGWLPRALLIVASLALGIPFFALSLRALSIQSPIWFDGPVLGIEEGIRAGRLYQAEALSTAPYVVCTHPPLSYLLAYPLYAAGWGPPALRVLNVLMILACAAMVYLLAGGGPRGFRPEALFAAAVFLALPPVLRWSLLMRCADPLSCFFDLAILLLLLRVQARPGREFAIGLLFTLAVLSKQSAVYTFGPILAVEAVRSKLPLRLAALRFLAAVVPLTIVFGSLQLWTDGGLATNVLYANLADSNIFHFLTDILVELGLFWLFAAWVWWPGSLRSLPHLWFLAAAGAGLLTAWKDGANTLYFFEASAALAILVGGVTSSLIRQARPISQVKGAVLVFLLTLVVFRSNAYAWRMCDPSTGEEYARLLLYLRQHKPAGGQLLTQDVSLSLALGERPLWNDALVLGTLAKQRRWDDRLIVSNIRQRRYYAVVSLVYHFWTPAMQKELADNYTRAATFGGTFEHVVYVPRPSGGAE